MWTASCLDLNWRIANRSPGDSDIPEDQVTVEDGPWVLCMHRTHAGGCSGLSVVPPPALHPVPDPHLERVGDLGVQAHVSREHHLRHTIPKGG